MEVYIDVLFFENLLINYLILFVTCRICFFRDKTLPLVIGAAVGAIYVVILVIFPWVVQIYQVIGRLLVSVLIIKIAFNPNSFKSFVKLLLSFYLVTFLFAGVAYGVINMVENSFIIVDGLLFYYGKTSFLLILVSLSTSILLIRLFKDIFFKKITKQNQLVALRISMEGREEKIIGLIDTGNMLYEPVSNSPVIVAESEAVKDLIPEEITSVIKNTDIKPDYNISTLKNIRIIPFNTIGKDHGIMYGFKPDKIEIYNEKEVITANDVVIGLYDKELSNDKSYRAIIGSNLVM